MPRKRRRFPNSIPRPTSMCPSHCFACRKLQSVLKNWHRPTESGGELTSLFKRVVFLLKNYKVFLRKKRGPLYFMKAIMRWNFSNFYAWLYVVAMGPAKHLIIVFRKAKKGVFWSQNLWIFLKGTEEKGALFNIKKIILFRSFELDGRNNSTVIQSKEKV